MGLFDGIFKFLKKGNYQKPIKNIEKSENKSNEPIVTTIYCYGHLFRIYPIPSWPYSDHIDLICKSNIIVSEDIRYDLTSKESIQSIAIPSYEIHGANKIDKDLGIASSLEFALRMKGDEYWKDKIFDLAIACYEKATQLMAVSDEAWEEEDFFLVVNRLKELGQIERAKKWEEWLEQNIYASDIVKEIEQELIREKSEDELLVFYDCGHIVKILPEPTFEKGYYEILDRIRAVKNIISDGEKYDLTEKENEKELNRIIFKWLQKNLPDDCPKSISGFQRMRNANSKNYQALVAKAEAAGFVFPTSLEEVTPWEGID